MNSGQPLDGLEVCLSKQLSPGHNASRVFSLDVQFTARAGVTVVFGASGAGKTTLLDLIAGLLVPDSGRISLRSTHEEEILFDSEHFANLLVQERRLGYVFQTLALFPHLSVKQNVGYGLRSLGERERDDRVREILDSFRIAPLAGHRPDRISGGERQRVALARSLVTRPRALLLDEPLSALDYTTKSKIMADLLRWNQQHPIPVLYVSHAIEEAFTVGDHVIVMSDGRIVKQGSPAEVLAAERDQLMRQLTPGPRL